MEEEKQMDEINEDKYYRSCCWTVDKAFVRFLIQISISYIVLALSIFKLITLSESADKSIYISLITLILGLHTEIPRLKKRNPTIEAS